MKEVGELVVMLVASMVVEWASLMVEQKGGEKADVKESTTVVLSAVLLADLMAPMKAP